MPVLIDTTVDEARIVELRDASAIADLILEAFKEQNLRPIRSLYYDNEGGACAVGALCSNGTGFRNSYIQSGIIAGWDRLGPPESYTGRFGEPEARMFELGYKAGQLAWDRIAVSR